MKKELISLSLVGLLLVSACTNEEVVESPRFDTKAIAAEADKGNLEPLKKLNEACTAEVKREGKRLAACKAQDDVGGFMKPLNIRF